jgi:hypothetical protein
MIAGARLGEAVEIATFLLGVDWAQNALRGAQYEWRYFWGFFVRMAVQEYQPISRIRCRSLSLKRGKSPR